MSHSSAAGWFFICIQVSGEEEAARPSEALSHSEKQPLMSQFSVFSSQRQNLKDDMKHSAADTTYASSGRSRL